jgi:hypothetical protein
VLCCNERRGQAGEAEPNRRDENKQAQRDEGRSGKAWKPRRGGTRLADIQGGGEASPSRKAGRQAGAAMRG